MLHKKHKKSRRDITRAIVTRELAQPRMARSARIAEMKLDSARVPEAPSSTTTGTVDKIILSPRPNQPEKAQIGIKGLDRKKQDLRIENSLTDEHGDDVKLKKGARVDVTVSANETDRRN
jgi:hypothetical protein